MPDDLDSGDVRSTTPPNPVPFVVALVGFVIVVVLAYVFLWEDEEGSLVAPDRIEVVADDTVRLTYDGPFDDTYVEVIQVGYALGEEEISVELVIDERDCGDGADCGAATDSLSADLVLPEPIGDREVRAGTGRALADCEGTGGEVTCR